MEKDGSHNYKLETPIQNTFISDKSQMPPWQTEKQIEHNGQQKRQIRQLLMEKADTVTDNDGYNIIPNTYKVHNTRQPTENYRKCYDI